MGPAHCTSGATYCSEISSTLTWGRKVPSVRGVPREGSTRVLSVERLCTSREVLRTLLPFRPRAILRLRLKARARSRSYTLHYSSCSTRRITQACVPPLLPLIPIIMDIVIGVRANIHLGGGKPMFARMDSDGGGGGSSRHFPGSVICGGR